MTPNRPCRLSKGWRFLLPLLRLCIASIGADSARADVFSDVPEAASEGYQVLYELGIPDNAGYRDTTSIPYTIDHHLTVPPFDRVAYYLTLTDGTGSHWVYVSMDAFTDVAKQLGLPHHAFNPVVHRQTVENMNIFSSEAGVATGTFIDGGNIEMWPNDYGQAGEVYASSSATFDWGDTATASPVAQAGYGSFQIHNPMARQTILAYNHWGQAGGANDDIGIGNRAATDTDWTFAANTGAYSMKKLVVLVRPLTHRVIFTQVPRNRAIIPRDPVTNRALVPVAGTESGGGHESAILRVYRDGAFQSETSQALIYAGGSATFSFSPQITAELAGYDFELLLAQGASRRLVRRVSGVAAGDVYLFYGQSNAEAGRIYSAGSTTANGYASPWVRTFGQNADSGNATRNALLWDTANGDGAGSAWRDPGAVGQWALVIGRKIVDTHGIPVALLNGARGGYSMPQLQKDETEPENLDDTGPITRPYNRLRYRALQGGVAAKARAMFFYQGEFDYDDAQQHRDGFANLRADWQADYPGLEHIYAVQTRPGCGVNTNNVALRQAQRAFGDEYPHTSVMATNALLGHDGCHYPFVNGYEVLGLNHFRQVSRDLYAGPAGPNIDALNPDTVEFVDASRTQIRVVMRDPGATINFPTAALADFALTGTSAGIVGRTVSGNTFTLQLNQPAVGDVGLEYRGHLGAGAWITNGGGVGLLSFSEPVGPFDPVVTLVSPAASQEADIGATLNLVAAAVAGPRNSVTRMVFYANGVPQFETAGSSLNTTWRAPVAGAHRLSVTAYQNDGATGSSSVVVLAGQSASPGGISAGLRIWFKAERGVVNGDGAVLSWQDQSGNLHHASQSSSASQPRYVEGLFGMGAGVQFDGNDALDSSGGMPTGSYTKIVRFKTAGTGFNNLISADTGGSDAARTHAFYAPNLRPSIYHSGSEFSATTTISPDVTTIATCSYETSGNAAKVYVNGVLRGSGTLAGDNTTSAFQLGAYMNNYYLTGSLTEVIVYDRVLNDTEHSTILAYLDDKYRTPFQLWQKYTFAGQGNTPSGDNDADGLSNLIEYALGLNPVVPDADSARQPRIARTNDTIAVTYQRAADHPDIITQLERSSDLIAWTPAGETSLGTVGRVETRRHTEPMTAGQRALFYRLRVTLP